MNKTKILRIKDFPRITNVSEIVELCDFALKAIEALEYYSKLKTISCDETNDTFVQLEHGWKARECLELLK